METFARCRRVGLAVAVLVAPLGCLSPTEAIVDISTDAVCQDVTTTGITAGKIEDLDTSPFGTTGSDCKGSGDIGSMVLVPRDGDTKDATFAFKVVTSLDAPIENCVPPDYGPRCIVATRAMRFVPHGPFHVPVRMSLACAGVTCPEGQTCEGGICASNTVDPVDCDDPKQCAPQPGVVPAWQQSFGGPGTQLARHLAAGADGTLVLSGDFEGQLDLGGGPLKAKDGLDIFLATFTQAGQLRWSASFGGAGADEGSAVAMSKSGDIYLLASFENSVDFGGGPVTAQSGSNLALVKFTSFGKFEWAIRVGDSATETPGAVAVDAGDNVYVSGSFSAATKIGDTTLTPAGMTDGFLASFTSSGDPRWTKAFGGPGDDMASSVAADEGGNVYLSGHFAGKVSFGSTDLTAAGFPKIGGTDVFLASFDSGGAVRWAKAFDGETNGTGLALASRGGRVVLTGSLGGTASIDGRPVGTGPNNYGFVATFGTDGKLAWAQSFGASDAGGDRGTSVDIAADGAVIVGGDTFATPIFGSKPLALMGTTNPFVAVLEPDGTPRWAVAFSSSPFGEGSGVAAGSNGSAFLAGWFTGDLEPTGLSSQGDDDLFLLHLTSP